MSVFRASCLNGERKKIMKKILFFTAPLLILVTFILPAKNSAHLKTIAEKTTENISKSDSEFIMDAAEGGLMEVKLGELAQKNASNADVKKFGEMMVTDHSKTNKQLVSLAEKKNIKIPDNLSSKDMKKYNDRAGDKNADFDKEYMSMMVDDHTKDVSDFEKEADKGDDADIKSFAQNTLPVLRHHLEMAKTTKDAVK